MTTSRTGPLALSEAHLAAALGVLAEAVTIQAADGRPVFANRAALELLGFASLAELLAADPAHLLDGYRAYHPDGTPAGFDELPGRQVLGGQHPPPMLLRWVRVDPDAPPRPRWSLIKATPLFDADGRVAGAVNVIEDVTDVTEADLGRRLLDEAARTLASSLDYEETLQHVARLAVPTLADWCAVDLIDARGNIVPVAVAHVDPEQVELARELRRRYPIDPDQTFGVPEVLRTGCTELIADISDDLLRAATHDEEHYELARQAGMRSALLVPLEASGRVIGVLSLVLSGEARRFTPWDVALVEELGRRAGAAVHNARLYTERGEISHVLQASMLPTRLAAPEGWTTALHHQAAGEANEVGGDIYDVQPAGEGRWLVLVGDVVGKGAGAAALTPRVRHTLSVATALTGDPRDGLTLLDDWLLEEPEPDRVACTVAAAVLEGGIARVACAGHPRPMLVAAGGVREIGPGGRMLGLERRPAQRELTEVAVASGEALVLYTDGVTDASRDGERFGPERLVAALESVGPGASAQALTEAVRSAVEAFAPGPPTDDIVILTVRRT